jgi:hypothetical protein
VAVGIEKAYAVLICVAAQWLFFAGKEAVGYPHAGGFREVNTGLSKLNVKEAFLSRSRVALDPTYIRHRQLQLSYCQTSSIIILIIHAI